MKELSLEKRKEIGCEALKFIKSICEDNQITYYLSCGTLLGAVRHKGFIPWDDDVDISMNRDNFEKFQKVMNEKPDDQYELLFIETNKDYSLPLAKIIDKRTYVKQLRQMESRPLGIWVDIFIMDEVPDDYEIRKKFYKKLALLERIWTFSQYKGVENKAGVKSVVKKILKKAMHNIGAPRLLALIMNRYAQKYRGSGSLLYGDAIYSPDREANTFKKEYYAKTIMWEFEGEKYSIPWKYDEYLTEGYGDYMTLPPENEQVSNHSIIAYLL